MVTCSSGPTKVCGQNAIKEIFNLIISKVTFLVKWGKEAKLLILQSLCPSTGWDYQNKGIISIIYKSVCDYFQQFPLDTHTWTYTKNKIHKPQERKP